MSTIQTLLKPIAAGATALAALALVGAPAVADDHSEMTKGEAKLAELLEGRAAGEPVRCIPTFADRRMRTIDNTAYVYGSGRTIYVQKTKRPEHIDDDDVMVVRKFGSTRLCKLDQITTVDRVSGMFTGVVFFEEFVPYTRIEDEKAADAK